jgi:hypothetical protein
MTGIKLERPEKSRNDRKAGTPGKPERPENRNDRKAGTIKKAGTTRKSGTTGMIANILTERSILCG